MSTTYGLWVFLSWNPLRWRIRWRRPTREEKRDWACDGLELLREVYLGPVLVAVTVEDWS